MRGSLLPSASIFSSNLPKRMEKNNRPTSTKCPTYKSPDIQSIFATAPKRIYARTELRAIVSWSRPILAASVDSASRASTRCDLSSSCDMPDAAAAAFPPVPSAFLLLSGKTADFLRESAPVAEEDNGPAAPKTDGPALRSARRSRPEERPAPAETAAAAFPLFMEACIVLFRKLNIPPPPPLPPPPWPWFDEPPGFDLSLLFFLPSDVEPARCAAPPSSTLRWSKARRSGSTRMGTGRDMPCEVQKRSPEY